MTEKTPPLKVIAIVEAKDGERELVRSSCIDLIEPTRAEAGCQQYVLHEDNENKNIFAFYETWDSKAALESHLQSAHFKRFGEVTANSVANVQIHQLAEYPA